MKHITPSPTLMRAQLQGPTNINVDERPFGDMSVPDTETPAPMEPVLIALIAASREIGVEIRWHGIQDKLKEAVALWGLDVVEKEFRDYATFIATLQNKVVKWDSFRLNRLTKQPTLQQLSSIKAKKTGSYMNSGPEHVKAALPKFEMDAWYYFNELQAGKMQIDAETLATLNRKIQVYPDGSMKQAMIKFYNNHLTV